MHGMNPRTILGKEYWDKTRNKSYKDNEYCCYACGIHKLNAKKYKWLEAHELWNINYENGKCKIDKIVPLCHYCHNFIHTGRLYMEYTNKKITYNEIKDILLHGINILKENNLRMYYFTYVLCRELGIEEAININIITYPEFKVEWKDIYLLLENKKYYSKFKDIKEWKKYYSN
jgi:hypothetical protein